VLIKEKKEKIVALVSRNPLLFCKVVTKKRVNPGQARDDLNKKR